MQWISWEQDEVSKQGREAECVDNSTVEFSCEVEEEEK